MRIEKKQKIRNIERFIRQQLLVWFKVIKNIPIQHTDQTYAP
jgi:hypothetical protein